MKRRILSFILFITVQLFLTTSIAPFVMSKEDPTGSSFMETGEASWYGPGFQGRKTANGERFDTHELTAAHKTLPFGTLLKVTNLNNNLFVIVRINDRGPYIKGRIIDLSNAAKTVIQMGGTAPVRIEEIDKETAEMYRNGIDPNETINESEIDTTKFATTDLYNEEVDADSKVFMQFTGEDGTTSDFELNKNLKTSGKLKIKVVTPKKEEDENTSSNLYQNINDNQSLITFYDLQNQPAIVRGYSIEVGTFNDKSLADRKIGRLERDGFTKIYLEEIKTKDPVTKTDVFTYKVLVGLYELNKSAKKDKDKLNKLKYQTKVVKIGE